MVEPVVGMRPLPGDPVESAHAAIPAGAISGELYIVAPTTAPTVALGAAGAITGSSLTWTYTFAIRNPVTDQIVSESTASSASAGLSPAAQQVDISAISVSLNPHVNCRRIYRGGSLVGAIYDNTTATFTDNTTSISGQPSVPGTNLTGQGITANVHVAPSTQNPAAMFSGKEAGNELFRIGGGMLRKGMTDFRMPFGPDDTIDYYSQEVHSGATFVVTSGRIAAIMSISKNSGTAGYLQVGGVRVTGATSGSATGEWLLHNPILVDAGVTIDASNTTPFQLTFVEFAKTNAIGSRIVPKVLNTPNTTAYTVPTDKMFVLLGVCDHLGSQVLWSDFIPLGGRGSMSMGYTTDLGTHRVGHNSITSPILMQEGVILSSNTVNNITIWGYEISRTW